MDSPKFSPLKPKKVLGIAAHPDDLDFGAAGTMATFAANGAEVHYFILTDGSNGTSDRSLSPAQLTEKRQAEQQSALEHLGGVKVHFADYSDGALEVTQQLKKDIVKIIRQVQPDVVVTMDPTVVYSAKLGMVNHTDHRAAGQAAIDAVFPLARDHLAFPELLEAGFEPHITPHLLLMNLNEHNFTVNISEHYDKKLAAIRAHESQFQDINSVLEIITRQASDMGSSSGVQYAEGFVRIDIR